MIQTVHFLFDPVKVHSFGVIYTCVNCKKEYLYRKILVVLMCLKKVIADAVFQKFVCNEFQSSYFAIC